MIFKLGYFYFIASSFGASQNDTAIDAISTTTGA
jgi:hypothetical protein